MRHGDVVPVGRLDVSVLATPGHTRHHQAFLAVDRDRREAGALFSGGSLLHGTVGRTDLVDQRLTYDLAEAQWSSARSLGALDPGPACTPPTGSAASARARR